METILFLTTSNLATNPRLVKEIKLALEMGFDPTVVSFSFNNWSKHINNDIVADLGKKINLIQINGNSDLSIKFIGSTLLERFILFMDRTFRISFFSGFYNKRSILLFLEIMRIESRFSLVVAHNPGAIFPAYWFSKRKKIKWGFDMEDYHPGETNFPAEQARTRRLIKTYLSKAHYLSFASPLIQKHTVSDLKNFTGQDLIINNYFPLNEFSIPSYKVDETNVLKLVWFSQNVDYGRGLEQIISIIKSLSGKAELHLYGNVKELFFDTYLKGCKNIICHGPLAQHELHKKLSAYDIGLALEKPEENLNRDLCLTNKMMAYFQSGLFILASNTRAQAKFINDNPGIGSIISMKNKDLENLLEDLYEDRANLRIGKEERYLIAKKYNWENESQKLKFVWEQIIS